jgi:surfeit locus 1 family protein
MAGRQQTASRRFRPTFWPTVLTIAALALLLGLGTWQLQRLSWKTALIDTVRTRMAAAPVPMPATIDDPAAWSFRPVRVEGRFLHEGELFVAPRTMDGRLGYDVLTPLVRTDAAAPGQVVMVDRGWIPEDRRDPSTRPDSRPSGTVAVEGVLRAPAPRGWFQPENDPGGNLWFWTDLPAMAGAAGVDRATVAPVILQAGPGDADRLPVGGLPSVDIPNNHLQYALTWYGLAAALLAIYLAWHRRLAESGGRRG